MELSPSLHFYIVASRAQYSYSWPVLLFFLLTVTELGRVSPSRRTLDKDMLEVEEGALFPDLALSVGSNSTRQLTSMTYFTQILRCLGQVKIRGQ